MPELFEWTPLSPPQPPVAQDPQGLELWADAGAVALIAIGATQTLFGLTDGVIGLLPLALGLIAFGLPHGAVDHLVALGLAARPLRPLPLTIVLLLYLAAGALMFALWWLLPLAAAISFLAITIYHWGKSDLSFEANRWPGPAKKRPLWLSLSHLSYRGLAPIGIPFLAFPQTSERFVAHCVELFAPASSSSIVPWQTSFAAFVLLAFLFDTLGHLKQSKLHPGLTRRIVMENIALALFFALVPPLISIGWYFIGWHGYRHTLRLCRYQPQELKGYTWRLRRFFKQSLPFTLLAIALLLALFIFFSNRLNSIHQLAPSYMILISCLTLPHLLLVEWMDSREIGISEP